MTKTGKFIRLTENATKQEYIGWRRMVDSKLRIEGYFEKPGSWVLDKQINAYDMIVTNLIGQLVNNCLVLFQTLNVQLRYLSGSKQNFEMMFQLMSKRN